MLCFSTKQMCLQKNKVISLVQYPEVFPSQVCDVNVSALLTLDRGRGRYLIISCVIRLIEQTTGPVAPAQSGTPHILRTGQLFLFYSKDIKN